MNKFPYRRERKYKFLILLVGGALLFLIGGAWVFSPLIADLVDLSAEASLLAARHAELEHHLSSAADIENRLEEGCRELARSPKRMADADNLVAVFSRLEETFATSAVTILRVNVEETKEGGADGFAALDVDLSVAADTDELLLDFLKKIEDFPYLTLIRDVSLTGGARSEGMEGGGGTVSDPRPRLHVLFSLIVAVPEQSPAGETNDDDPDQ